MGYQLDFGMVNGRRKKKAYKSRKAAETALAAAQKLQKRHGEMGRLLTPGDVAEFILARERLNGVAVITAVEFYLANARIVKQPILLTDLIKRFMDFKEKQGRGDRYGEVEGRLEAFALSVPGRHGHEIDETDVERWIHGNVWAPKTRNNYLGELRALFAWGVRMKHLIKNPAQEVERAGQAPDAEIEVLTAAEAESLLRMAHANVKHRPLLGFVVIGLFCGVRPEELRRLHWDAVDLTAGTIVVAGMKAKSRKRRVVDVSANAKEWLAAVRPSNGMKMEGEICPRTFPERWEALRQDCGWSNTRSGGKKDWPHDGMRHTFASMHYAMHQNEALLQVLMGHESKEQLHRHYRAVTTKAEAEAFWAIMPEAANAQ